MGNMLVLSTFQDGLHRDNGCLELTPSYLSTLKLNLRCATLIVEDIIAGNEIHK